MPLIMLVNEQIEKTRTALTKVASRVVKTTNWGDVQQKPQKSVIRVARSNKIVISGRVGKISKSKSTRITNGVRVAEGHQHTNNHQG